MKVPKLMSTVIKDSHIKCSTVGSSRDIKTVCRRYTHEGLSFLTITLPAFGDDFFKAIEQGKVTSDLFVGWRKDRCLPAFLKGFTRLVFDEEGLIKDEDKNVPMAIAAIRQITRLYKKVKIECTKERKEQSLNSFIATDQELCDVVEKIEPNWLDCFDNVSRIVLSDVLGAEFSYEALLCHHGPGATAEHCTGNYKYNPALFPWFSKLDQIFFREDLLSANAITAGEDSALANQECLDGPSVVRVTSVPKTQTAERVIAIEPVVIQMAQQGIKDFLVDRLERASLTAGHINFTSQSINQRLALLNSITGESATLDLKSASDRVHKDLIWRMFSVHPNFRDYIFLTRSEKALVGDVTLELQKFASMGSALCFPVESLFFYIVMITGVLLHKGLPPTYHNVKQIGKDLYVYGDDIVCPVCEVDVVVGALEKFGCVVARTKSFWLSRFRESCGVDAYNGEVVTPVYLRQLTPDDEQGVLPEKRSKVRTRKKLDVKKVLSLAATHDQFFEKGYEHTTRLLRESLFGMVGFIPTLPEDSSGLSIRREDHEICDADYKASLKKISRFNRRLQRIEVHALVPQPIFKKDRCWGWHALHKCLLNLERRQPSGCNSLAFLRQVELVSSVDEKHLYRSPKFGALALKRRWV